MAFVKYNMKRSVFMPKRKRTITEYRSYSLPWQFPLLLLSGDHWKISDIPSDRLHFHNCLEIGICHSYSGSLMVFDEPVPFRSGDVTVVPKNVPHTTYSAPGTESLWSYIFVDPQALFRNMLPVSWKNFDLSQYAHRGMQVIFGKDEYPQIYQLALTVLRELEDEKPGYQISAKGLLLSLYIKVAQAFSVSSQSRAAYGFKDTVTTPPRVS